MIKGWLVCTALLAGCSGATAPLLPLEPGSTSNVAHSTRVAARTELTLSVLTLNDLHGRLGALPAFAGYVAALREKRAPDGAVLLLDAGDAFQGTLSSNRSEGGHVIRAYNALGIAAAAVGNHEFDYGPVDGATGGTDAEPQGALRARLREAKFPFLAANLVDTATGKLPAWQNLHASTVVRVAGARIGLVGVLTQETPRIVMRDYFAGLGVTALAPAVEREARALRRSGVDALLVVAHAGADCARFDAPHDLSSCDDASSEAFDLARALPRGLVDGIVAAHTHAGVAHVVNGIAIVEAFARGKAFGRLDLRFQGAPPRLVEVRPFPPEPLCESRAELAPCPTHPYEGLPVTASAELQAVIEPALELARDAFRRQLGVQVTAELKGTHDTECPLGNLFADAMLAHVPDAQVAISNGGSLRAPLPAGPLSYGELYECMPFDNRLVKLSIAGAELRRVLETHLSHDRHGILSLGGFSAAASCHEGRLRVALTDKIGRSIPDGEQLVLVTSDYLATGGDGLFAPIALDRARVEAIDGVLVRDALAAELSKLGRIDPAAPRWFDAKRPRLALPSRRPVVCTP